MLAAHDVIDLVGEPRVVFVDKAILATIFRAAGYRGSQMLTDVTGHVTGFGGPLP